MRATVPTFFRLLLRAVAPPRERAWLLADLEEEAAARARVHGDQQARAWSRRQVITSLLPLLGRRLDAAIRLSWSIPMHLFRHLGSDLEHVPGTG